MSLDSYLNSKSPKPISTSQEIRDRSSLFVASIYECTSLAAAKTIIKHVRNVVHGQNKATHEIAAWRCMVLKEGKTGLGGPDDFEIKGGYEDDGENWAGEKILKVMEGSGVVDAVVVVSRWYGGTMLGPVRFTHIETCSAEVCRAFRIREEVNDRIVELKELDDRLAALRAEFVALSRPDKEVEGDGGAVSRQYDYDSMLLNPPDLPKAKRLVVARHHTLKSITNSLAAKRKELENV